MPAASLDLPEYPFHPSHAMRKDPSLLARLLESYREAAGTAEDAAEFLFGYARRSGPRRSMCAGGRSVMT